MSNSYQTLVVCLVLIFGISRYSFSQTFDIIFQDCDTNLHNLCVNDPGVSLPDNNRLYLGEANPIASSCNVHLSQNVRVISECDTVIQYFVELIIDDTVVHVLQPLTTLVVDSTQLVELTFDSRHATDSLIRNNGIPYTTDCAKNYRIKWTAQDPCGNVEICERKINLYDCQPPVFQHSAPLFIVRSNLAGFVFIEADTLFTGLTDDCTDANDFLFSLSPDQYSPDSLIHMCDLPAWSVELTWPVWIADKGVDNNCNGTIEWNERQITPDSVLVVFINEGEIDCFTEFYIKGEVTTEYDRPLGNVKITLTIPGPITYEDSTDEYGKYQFVFNEPVSGVVNAEKEDIHRNGVSTLDLIKIQKHLLGSEKFNSPYKVIAADANNSQSVSAVDILELRKLVLGIYTQLPNNSAWRFIPKDHVFSNPLKPWPFPDSVAVETQNSLDFIGVKIGDVNGTVHLHQSGSVVRSTPASMSWSVEDKGYAENEFVDIEFTLSKDFALKGFQFTISSDDLEFIQPVSGSISLEQENYAVFNDKITFSWFSTDALSFKEGEVLFKLHAKTKSPGKLSKSLQLNSDITTAEAYSSDEEVFIPELDFKSADEAKLCPVVSPNPWTNETSISFDLTDRDDVLLEVFDLHGSLILKKHQMCPKGKNIIHLNEDDLGQTGLFIYRLSINDSTSQGKMIALD